MPVDLSKYSKATQERKSALSAPAEPFALGGFMGSALDSTLELFGAEPSLESEKFRADYPIAGIVSELLGFGVPYAGWFKATTKIPKVVNTLDKIGESTRFGRVGAGAAKEAARFAPFEAGRIAISEATGGDTGEVSLDAAISLGIAGGFGAVGGIWKAAKAATGLDLPEGARLQHAIPGLDLAAPRQHQLRNVSAALDQLKGAPQDQARSYIQGLSVAIRNEARSGRYVEKLAGDKDAHALDRLFKVREGTKAGGHIDKRLLNVSQKGFDSPAAWQKIVSRAGLPEDWLGYAQFPRYIAAKSPTGVKAVKNAFKNLDSVGDGWYVGREADEGAFVLAKRLDEGKAGASPEWLALKTDVPGYFIPKRSKYADFVAKRQVLTGATVELPQELNKIHLWKGVDSFTKALPLERVLGIPKGKPEEIADFLLSKMGVKPEALGSELSRLRQFAKSYLAPSLTQFSESVRARWLHGVARYTFDAAAATSEAMIYGPQRISKSGSLFKEIFGTQARQGGIKGLVDELNEQDLKDVWNAWQEGLTPAEAVARGASSRTQTLLNRLGDLDAKQVEQLQLVGEHLKGEKFTPLAQHYMISRTWKGDWRVPIKDDTGRVVYYAAGKVPKEAAQQAQDIVKRAPQLKIGDKPRLSDRTADLELASHISMSSPGFRMAKEAAKQTILKKARKPKFFEERAGVGGYLGEETPWTKQELLDILAAHVTQQNRYMAETVVRSRLMPELFQLAEENPQLYEQIVQRINDMAGKPTAFARAQNQVIERALAPYLGKNPATKIVSFANTALMNFQLGMGNVAFPVINAMTFLQTTMPHVSFVMTAAPERVARYYTHFPIGGADGKIKGTMGVINQIKLQAQTIKEMAKPGAELRASFERAAREGVWDPRFVEEYVGEKSKLREKLGGLLKGEGGYVDFIKGVSEWMPAQSEKFSRGQSFSTGYILGRDFLNLKDEQLYQFAKEFVHNTMYLYSTADRARIITGPMGSFFGMFKNWQMHYMAQMLLYADEAALKGNFAPLLWQLGGTASLAGVSGLPLYGVADQLSKEFSDKSLMQNIYEGFGGGDASDAIYMGLPGALGFSLNASAAAPGSDLARDASMLFSFAHYNRLRDMGKAFGEAIDHWTATGQHPITGGLVRDKMAKAFLPKTIGRAVQVAGDDGLRSLNTGNPLVRDMTPIQQIIYSLGLTPDYVEKTFSVAGELWRDQDRRRNLTSVFGRAFNEARMGGDWDELQRITVRALAMGLDMTSVARSAASFAAKGREDMIERQFDPRRSAELSAAVLGRR